jgi:phosphoglycerate dehydrogenase-like enzyme
MFARKLDRAASRLPGQPVADRNGFGGMSVLEGKTIAIIGGGGIGTEVARLAGALGMHVVVTRRSAEPIPNAMVLPSRQVHSAVAAADVVAVCAMLTPESERLIDASVFAAMKPGTIFVNIARGELIDEQALIASLYSGRLSGAYLDVWVGDVEGTAPSAELLAAPNLVLTPHAAGGADLRASFGDDVFVENFGRFVRREPLLNVVDWDRGY